MAPSTEEEETDVARQLGARSHKLAASGARKGPSASIADAYQKEAASSSIDEAATRSLSERRPRAFTSDGS